MTGWLILLAVAGAALLGLRLLGLRGSLLQLGAAALLFGCAGYALQGNPGLGGSPRVERADDAPVPLTRFRHAFFGQFSGAESWMRISEAVASRGDTDKAVGVLKSAVRERPGEPMLWIGLGNALVDHARGVSPASQFAYHRAAELAPGHPAPPFFMGLALARSGHREAAIAMWEELLENAPADAAWRPLVEDAAAAVRPR